MEKPILLLFTPDAEEEIITCSLFLETTCVVACICIGAGLAGAFFFFKLVFFFFEKKTVTYP